MFRRESLRHDNANDVIYDTDGAREGRYGCIRGPIWVHARADMGSREPAVKGLESRAVSAWVTKNFVTISVKHVIIGEDWLSMIPQSRQLLYYASHCYFANLKI